MAPLFTRVTVHTVGDSANQFHVFVNDLENILARMRSLKPETAVEFAKNTNILALERAVFIQQAIEEKIERSKP